MTKPVYELTLDEFSELFAGPETFHAKALRAALEAYDINPDDGLSAEIDGVNTPSIPGLRLCFVVRQKSGRFAVVEEIFIANPRETVLSLDLVESMFRQRGDLTLRVHRALGVLGYKI
jgi:hypothetical protein